MQVFKNEKLEIDFDLDTQLMEITRFQEKNNEEYKETVRLMAAKIEKHRPKKILVNTLNFDFPIPPELQDWAVKLLAEQVIKINVEKVAYVMPQDFIANLAMEDIMHKAKQFNLNIRYFSNYDEAKKWLLS